MNENNSIKTIDKTNLTEQTKFLLREIIGIENYFYQEINQRKLNKCVTVFDYKDKILNVLNATSSGASAEIASFTLIFSITTGIVKKLLSITRKKQKKHDKILMLAKSKLNNIENKSWRIYYNLRSENEKYMSNDISCKQCIKLWDKVVHVKATYKVKDLSGKK